MAEVPEPEVVTPPDTTGYAAQFTEASFWQKVKDFAAKIGRGPLQKAMELYKVAMSPDTPLWAKATALGSLGYLISPLDFIPDFIPVAGLTDDVAALGAAVTALMKHITPEIKDQAKALAMKWLGGGNAPPPLPPAG